MDVDDLWIGDQLIIKSSGKQGTFEGKNGQRIRVRVGNKILLVKPSNIILAPENPEEDPDLGLHDDLQSSRNDAKRAPTGKPQREIDLHLDKLPPFEDTRWQTAIEYQIDTCRRFIISAIEGKIPTILIIHGKGKGILKKEILHLLEEYTEVYLKLEVNKGGAIEVWMQY